jgi:antirestriction protein
MSTTTTNPNDILTDEELFALGDTEMMVVAYCDWLGKPVTHEAVEEAVGAYTGHDTVTSYVEELLDEGLLGDVSEWVRSYVDIERIADDMEMGGEVVEHDGYVFRTF